jgi:hypothetical protein
MVSRSTGVAISIIANDSVIILYSKSQLVHLSARWLTDDEHYKVGVLAILFVWHSLCYLSNLKTRRRITNIFSCVVQTNCPLFVSGIGHCRRPPRDKNALGASCKSPFRECLPVAPHYGNNVLSKR